MREDVAEFLEFVVGGRPSRFMMHEADWDRLYRFTAYVAGLDVADRPSEVDVRDRIYAALPRRAEWADEIMLAYRHVLAALDRSKQR
ncbi:MAG: hypothetical protein IT299_00595 [Dehalococcoidia bacterium]|nr:hypothetical protein [Dehalococcoidia bacterium]